MLIIYLPIMNIITVITPNKQWQYFRRALVFKEYFLCVCTLAGYAKEYRNQGLPLKYHINDFDKNIREIWNIKL